MKELINFDDVNTKIIAIRNQNVILDSDVATLYGVETKRVNEAVRNNPKKFPEGYVFQLKTNEYQDLCSLVTNPERPDNQDVVENLDRILTINHLKTSSVPKAFTEKGLYMLATILKSDRAIEATIAIVEAFARLKELTHNIAILNSIDAEIIEPEIIEKTGNLFNDLFFSGLPTSAETTVEFNIGVMKGKRKIKYEKPIYQSEFDELKRMVSELKQQNEKLLQNFTSTNK